MPARPRVCTRAQIVMVCALLVACAVVGCGRKSPPQRQEIKVVSAEFRTHHVGGPNYFLIYEVELHSEPGGQQIEIIETADGHSESPFSFPGIGRIPINLQGTFVNDGDTSRLEALQEQLSAAVSWPSMLVVGTQASFLEYEGLDGQKVQYELRLSSTP